jgi:hypothetical protein
MAKESAAQNKKNEHKCSTENEETEQLKRKQFYRKLERSLVDKEKFLVWLWSLGMQGETENLIIAAQDQVLNTRYHQRNIMKQPTDS